MHRLQKFRTNTIIVAVAALLAGCGSDTDSTRSATPIEGTWAAPAYGQIYQFSRSGSAYTSAQFHVTKNSCLPGLTTENMTDADIADITQTTDSPDKIEIRRAGQRVSPGVTYSRLETLPALCTDSRLAVKGQPGYVFDPRRDFQIFWDTFNERYFDFTLSGTDWQAVYDDAQIELDSVESEQDLFELFARAIEPLEDSHTTVIQGNLSNGIIALIDGDTDFQEYSLSYKPDQEDRLLTEYARNNGLTLPLNDAQLSEFETFLEDWEARTKSNIIGYADSPVETASDDLFVWFKLENNIGYLFIDSLSGFGDSDFDIANDTAVVDAVLSQVVTDMQSVDGLIIDLRFNEGGNDEVSLAIASHFAVEPTHVYSKQARSDTGRTQLIPVTVTPAANGQFLGPIVLLTSTTTASAAEVLTLAMRNFSNVRIAGEPTAGTLSDELPSRVTADIAFSLSNEFYLSPTGEWFERSGIPVDHDVPFWTPELHDQDRDPGIEKAAELLEQ